MVASLAGLGQDEPFDVASDEEARIFAEALDFRGQGRNVAVDTGVEQLSEQSADQEPEAPGHRAPLESVDEQQFGTRRNGERNRCALLDRGESEARLVSPGFPPLVSCALNPFNFDLHRY
jgi:hypothetical protein